MEQLLPLGHFLYIFILALPVACISWTVTHEEIFSESREYCVNASKTRKQLITRKFFYVFTCEYCFSHYVSLFFIIAASYQVMFTNWLGYVIAWFSLVWIANVYMSLYSRIRIGIKKDKTEISVKEEQLNQSDL